MAILHEQIKALNLSNQFEQLKAIDENFNLNDFKKFNTMCYVTDDSDIERRDVIGKTVCNVPVKIFSQKWIKDYAKNKNLELFIFGNENINLAYLRKIDNDTVNIINSMLEEEKETKETKETDINSNNQESKNDTIATERINNKKKK